MTYWIKFWMKVLILKILEMINKIVSIVKKIQLEKKPKDRK